MPRIHFSDAARTRLLGSLGGAFRAAVLLVIAAVMIDGLIVSGLWSPVVVSSGSMAPALVGPHVSAKCGTCGEQFAIDADGLPPDGNAICPNCGNRTAVDASGRMSGDRVLVDRTAFAFRQPRRWETVVFRSPEEPRTLAVKRIVGLPGDTIEIRDGDVYVDGEIVRKTLAEFRSVAVETYDLQHWAATASGRLIGWQREPHRWEWHDGHLVFHGAQEDRDASPNVINADWALRFNGYHQKDESASAFGSSGEQDERAGAINDDLGYNQALHQPPLAVSDWLLDCQIKISGAGELRIRVDTARGRAFWLDLDTHTLHWQLWDETRQQSLAEGKLPAELERNSWQLTVAAFDAQIIAAWNGRADLHYDFEPSPAGVHASAAPFSFGPRNVDVDLSNIHIWRDVYYRDAPTSLNLKPGQAVKLGADEYFLLGDNSAISDDSRTWSSGPAVPRRSLLGKPILLQRW